MWKTSENRIQQNRKDEKRFTERHISLLCYTSFNTLLCMPFNITVIQVYASAIDAEEAEVDQF